MILRVIIFLTALLLSITACGASEEEIGPGAGLSLEEYGAAVKALQDDAQVRSEVGTDYQTYEPPTTEQEALVVYQQAFGSAVDALAAFFDGMRALQPPSEIRDEHDALLESGTIYLSDLRDRVAAVDDTDSIEELYTTLLVETEEGAEFAEACDQWDRTLRSRGFELEAECEYALDSTALCLSLDQFFERDSACGTAEGTFCEVTGEGGTCSFCETIPGVDTEISPPPGQDGVACQEIDFGGVDGRHAPMPALPSGLVAVSDYLEFDIEQGDFPAVRGFAMPLTEDVTDPASIGFYTYEQGEWRHFANVAVISQSRAEGEFPSMPANIAVLSEAN